MDKMMMWLLLELGSAYKQSSKHSYFLPPITLPTSTSSCRQHLLAVLFILLAVSSQETTILAPINVLAKLNTSPEERIERKKKLH
jgi:hypothetical protein